MPHNTSGLPKLDLEPFDPAPLYAAARSPRRHRDRPHDQPSRYPLALVALVVVLLALGGLASLLLR